MKKRIVCLLLTLIMLMSLLPLSASAASRSVSESAITVLKQLEGYSGYCNGYKTTYGYGSTCTDKTHTGKTFHGEAVADTALREQLAELDKAINNMGLSLTQSKHDALVLFSFQNGTAWTTGTGDFKAAVTSGATGSEFLNAICRWSASDDNSRREIEANMYLYGKYSSSTPSYFITVNYDVNGGSMAEDAVQYHDIASSTAITIEPTKDYHTFTGWYIDLEANDGDGSTEVKKLSAYYDGKTLTAGWVPTYSMPGFNVVNYVITESQLLSTRVYIYNEEEAEFEKVDKDVAEAEDFYSLEEALYVDSEYLDEDGVRWCRIKGTTSTATGSGGYWVKASYNGTTKGSSGTDIDVTVTVTNSYVRSRKNATIYSVQNGTYYQGDQLRIINTDEADGYLWGQVAKSADDDTAIGWVALMYTNWDAVTDGAAVNNSTVIATATITFNGYVNVRSEAGTDNKIVGALVYGTTVNLYETKYVNGIQWGRCSTGWICLSYANVTRLVEDTSYTSDIGFTAYAFAGTINPDTVEIYEEPSASSNRVFTRMILDSNVTITNLVSVTEVVDGNTESYTWGKFDMGWVRVTNNTTYQAADVNLNTAKFYTVADSVTVRNAPETSAARVDTLVKNVEFNVNEKYQVIVVGETIWGFADKVGEDNKTYSGWINLASKYVSRGDAPELSDDDDDIITGLMGTVINTDSLKVRKTGASYGTQIGTLSRGTTVAVWEENDDGWYKVDSNQNGVYDYSGDGWVSGTYLDVYEGTASGSSSSSSSSASGTVETGLGIVANTYTGVNVRQGAGTGYAAVGKLLTGTTVEILEVTTVGVTKWGRVAQGWVCMDYVTMVSNYAIAGSASSSGTSNSTTTSETVIFTGTTKAAVKIRKEPSLSADVVRELAANANVTVHELLAVTETTSVETTEDGKGSTTTTEETTSYWARLNDGYLYNPQGHLNLDTLDEVTYTVTGYETLNVRKTAGTTNSDGSAKSDIIHKLAKGDVVTVTKLQIVNTSVWGYVEVDAIKATTTTDEEGNEVVNNDGWSGEGWVNMSYLTQGVVTFADESTSSNTGSSNTTGSTTNNVTLGNTSSTGGFVTNTSGYRYTGKVIRTNSLNVRATASETASKTTTLSSGQAMVIYETSTVNGMAWGRCDAGWVYLYYVDLTPVTGAVDARVVANENTIIYSDMNCSSVAGTYAKQSVIDIYEIVGKMARTELGWVNTDNLL